MATEPIPTKQPLRMTIDLAIASVTHLLRIARDQEAPGSVMDALLTCLDNLKQLAAEEKEVQP